ncbi:MAG: DKNYY domain-containing protein [Candidatus Parcubacteria bacterium]|nr:DKNYY domain-containing protein [Candidatus Parcubacteria bacterium]
MNTKLAWGILLAIIILGAGGYWYTHIHVSDSTSVSSGTTTQTVVTPTWLPISALPASYDVSVDTGTWYSMQNGQVYCMYSKTPIANIDVATFVFSSLGEYAKDKNHVYRCSDIVKDADATSFTVLNKAYAKDLSHVFYSGKSIVDANATSFTVVPSPQPDGFQTSYGKDNMHVYNLFQKIPNADPATFVILSPFIPVDKNWIYKNNVVFGPASLIDETYAEALPANCTKTGQWTPKPAPVPSIFSKDETVVGYVGPNAVCIIDKKTQKSEYYEKGWEDGVALSDDGSKLYYSIFAKGMGGGTCADCGKYAIDRATGSEERVK